MRIKRFVASGLVVAAALGLSGCNPQKNNTNYVTVLKSAGESVTWCHGAENVPDTPGLSNYLNCGNATATFTCKTTVMRGDNGNVASTRCDSRGVWIDWFTDDTGDHAYFGGTGYRSGHVDL